MKEFKDVIIKDRNFEDLRDVLESWIKLVTQYCEAHQGKDACYWYNERATLSVLAAAIWKTDGWIALEEFSTEKICKEEKIPKTGRCDLYFENTDNNKNSYACEAKQAWHKSEDSTLVIANMLTDAWKDASELVNDEADNRLAICFCVPSFKESPTDDQVDEWLKKCQTFNHVVFAYSFPSGSRELKSNYKEKRIFPGVAVIIQHRQRGVRCT